MTRVLVLALGLLLAFVGQADAQFFGHANTAPLSCDGTNCTLASGQLRLPAGTAGSPAIAGSAGETSTGIFWPGSAVLRFTNSGTASAQLQASQLQLTSSAGLAWSSAAPGGTSDVVIRRDGAGIFAQRDDLNAQTMRGYRTFTDLANYERWALQSGAGFFELAAETAGTGTDNIDLRLTPAGTGNVSVTSGNVTLANAGTVGVTGAARAQFNTAGNILDVGLASSLGHTTGGGSGLAVTTGFNPASGSSSFAALQINPIINGTSSGTAYGLVVASRTNTLTGGTIRLASFGTTTTDAFTGYTEQLGVTLTGDVIAVGALRAGAANNIGFGTTRTQLTSPLDGILLASNSAESNFTRLILGTNNTSGAALVKTGAALQVALGDGTLGGSLMGIPVATQTIAAGNTVTADACGTIKRISAAGAVTTDTVNTFTAPADANAGCTMYVVNVGSFNITLDANGNFVSPGAADVVMTPNDAILVGSSGATGAWYALSALVAN